MYITKRNKRDIKWRSASNVAAMQLCKTDTSERLHLRQSRVFFKYKILFQSFKERKQIYLVSSLLFICEVSQIHSEC